ncbi:unnamed protein product [Alternaria alternata]
MRAKSIVSKVHAEIVDLAETYADAGRENVTLSLIADFQRAVFPLLNEHIRIKDLEQSEELRDEIVQLLGDEHPTKPAWPYLNQLDKQDRCFAKMGSIDEEHRPAKFKVEDAQYLSVDDFSYDRGSLMSEVQVCQLRTKSGALVWVPMEDYLRLKHEYVRLASSDESEWDDGIVIGEDMNQQNANVGK